MTTIEADAPVAVDDPKPADAVPVSKDAQDAKYLSDLAAENPTLAASESTRLSAQKAVEATLQPGDRLETYDEAWARLALPGRPTVDQVRTLGVVLAVVKGK